MVVSPAVCGVARYPAEALVGARCVQVGEDRQPLGARPLSHGSCVGEKRLGRRRPPILARLDEQQVQVQTCSGATGRERRATPIALARRQSCGCGTESSLTLRWREPDSEESSTTSLIRTRLSAGGRWIRTCMGLFLSSGGFWFLPVLCSERERPFFVPSPAIRFAERAEGVKGPKR